MDLIKLCRTTENMFKAFAITLEEDKDLSYSKQEFINQVFKHGNGQLNLYEVIYFVDKI